METQPVMTYLHSFQVNQSERRGELVKSMSFIGVSLIASRSAILKCYSTIHSVIYMIHYGTSDNYPTVRTHNSRGINNTLNIDLHAFIIVLWCQAILTVTCYFKINTLHGILLMP